MITEKDLLEAIAECQGQRNPNANTCIKLAAYYTILQNIREDPVENIGWSYSAPQTENHKAYESGTEFGQVIQNFSEYEILSVMDELMSTLKVLQPRLYDGVMRKFE